MLRLLLVTALLVTLPPFSQEGIQNLSWAETTRRASSSVASWINNNGASSVGLEVRRNLHTARGPHALAARVAAGRHGALAAPPVASALTLAPAFALDRSPPFTGRIPSLTATWTASSRRRRQILAEDARKAGKDKNKNELMRNNQLTAVLRADWLEQWGLHSYQGLLAQLD
ncbi:Uu.00g056670.m01.CDS01 [Anthostomella pinea]|uniref:Uu.00g056670.m01.CDS01 n=1 Tax=Anthostomella pinea TaxID=933095 RepID=A0AAI8YM26_9PEZI|nr:Uu.00g056670.m01.CDS01 [Anthostomella pinea]